MFNNVTAEMPQDQGVFKDEGGPQMLVSHRQDICQYFADQEPNSKITDVCSEFSSVRKVCGDGNCFYRAFSFSFLESLIQNPRGLQRFTDMVVESNTALLYAGFEERSYMEHFQTVTNVLEVCQAEGSVETLYAAFNHPPTSDSVVQYLRLLTSAQLRNNEDFYASFVEAPNLQLYCHQEIETMSMQCDHVGIQALSQALDVGIHIVSMEGEEQKPVHHIIPEGAEPFVHLLYQGWHYNILYPQDAASSTSKHVH